MAGSRVPDVTNAAIDALVADSTLTTLLGGAAKCYTHVPEDTAPPYVFLLGGQERPWEPSFRDESAREVEVDCLIVSAYRGTTELDNIAHQVITRLTADGTYSGVTGYAGNEFKVNERPYVEQVEGRMFFSRRVTLCVYCAS
jgi:hypothetical protein